SAAVAELVLLAAPAEAGFVAAGDLVDPDGLRHGSLAVAGHRLGVDVATGGGLRRARRPHRLRALHRALGRRALEPAGALRRGRLLPDHLQVEDVADEVV